MRSGAVGLVVALAVSVAVVASTGEPAAAAATIRVPQDQPTIRDAIDRAVDGDTVLVAPGTYAEKVDFGAKDLIIRSSGGPAVTTIEGIGGSVVLMGPGGRLEGFTITGGREPLGWALVPGDGSVVRGNWFVGNEADDGYGPSAIRVNETSPVIDRNRFEHNTCDEQSNGGVITLFGPTSARITNNVFADNVCRSAVNINAGITGATPMLVANNTITRGHIGIELDVRSGPVIIRNNLITDNEVGYRRWGSDPPTFDHNFLGGNRQDFAEGTSSLIGIDGNITGDPRVVDASSNYELRAGSPLVDAGSSASAPSVDFEGDPRPVGAGVDIGAFERDGSEPLPPTTGMLDTAWSGDGIGSLGSRYTIALAPLPSGRLYAASWRESDGGPMRVARYDPDGSLDERYGSGGYLLRSFVPGGQFSSAHAVLLDGNRHLLVGDSRTGANLERLGVARLTTTGAYDGTFSGDGRVAYRVFQNEHDHLEAFRVRPLPDGRVMGAVAAYDYDRNDELAYVGQAVFRLRADGSLDPSFTGDGREVVPDDWSDFAFRPDGSFYVGRKAGTTHEIRRFGPSGTIDRSFSGDGKASVACGPHRGIAIGSDTTGRVVLVCVDKRQTEPISAREHWNVVWTMFRLTTAGQPDPAWSGDGRSTFVLDDWYGSVPELSLPWLTRIDDRGRPWIVTAGSPGNVAGGRALELYRFGPDGGLDPSWSADGIQRTLLPFPVDFNTVAFGGTRVVTAIQETPGKVALVSHVTT